MIKKTVSQCTSSDYCKGWNDAIDDCKVKPITDYNNASSDAFKAEVNEITMDKWE